MPDRDRNTVTQRVTLGDGQINFNGTVFDVNGITFTQDGIVAAAFNTDTATIASYDEYEEAIAATTTTTYNPYFTHEDLQRSIDQVVETLHTYAVSAQDIQYRDGFDAWATYNPYIYSIVTEDEEPELDEKNDKLDGFLGEFIKEAV